MNEQKSILLVEDNEQLNRINKRALERAQYRVLTALTLAQAREHFQTERPHLIILDVMLPDGSGIDFCKEIRNYTASPILFLTSVSGYEQTLQGLVAGGDDYLNKPFDLDLLIAKVAAFLRRDEIFGRIHNLQGNMTMGLLSIEIPSRTAYLNDKDIQLSSKEFSVLMLLMKNKQRDISSKMIYEEVWKQPMGNDSSALKITISRLRRKLETGGFEITAIRGKGYRLRDLNEKD